MKLLIVLTGAVLLLVGCSISSPMQIEQVQHVQVIEVGYDGFSVSPHWSDGERMDQVKYIRSNAADKVLKVGTCYDIITVTHWDDHPEELSFIEEACPTKEDDNATR
jgi:hypothetical protein